uniref:Uncharacterized protein n=1 Tax=Lepeophtheirus salmonis TaxID=72036 RepID=A0A0K2TWZ2_LEPSM
MTVITMLLVMQVITGSIFLPPPHCEVIFLFVGFSMELRTTFEL